jgi:hypothetical protein
MFSLFQEATSKAAICLQTIADGRAQPLHTAFKIPPPPDLDGADRANRLGKLPGPIGLLASNLSNVRQSSQEAVFEDTY